MARFLLYRALHNRTLVGHYLFWYLKAALNGSPTDQRYLALIQARNRHLHTTVVAAHVANPPHARCYLSKLADRCDLRFVSVCVRVSCRVVSLVVQVYMESCGEHADELFAQLEIVAKLRQLNEAARTYKKAERYPLSFIHSHAL